MAGISTHSRSELLSLILTLADLFWWKTWIFAFSVLSNGQNRNQTERTRSWVQVYLWVESIWGYRLWPLEWKLNADFRLEIFLHLNFRAQNKLPATKLVHAHKLGLLGSSAPNAGKAWNRRSTIVHQPNYRGQTAWLKRSQWSSKGVSDFVRSISPSHSSAIPFTLHARPIVRWVELPLWCRSRLYCHFDESFEQLTKCWIRLQKKK